MAWKTKMQTEEKNNARKRGRSERRNCLESVFIHLIRKRSRKCLLLLHKLFTLLCVIPSVLLAASSQIASKLSQCYSHTNVLFEYHMNIQLFKN